MKILRISFLVAISVFIFCFCTFANYSKGKRGAGYSNTEYQETSFPYCASSTINNMKMTQDDYNFYIDFDIDYECPTLTYDLNKENGVYNEVYGGITSTSKSYENTNLGFLFVSETANAGIYKSYTNDFSGDDISGSTRYIGSLSFDGKYSNWDYSDVYKRNGSYRDTYAWNGNTYYIFPNDFWEIKGECNSYNTNGNTITYNTYCDRSVNYWKYNVKGRIVINKNDVEHYRYLNLSSPYAVVRYFYYHNRSSASSNTSVNECNGDGLYCNAVDLSNYTKCDHDWEIINIGDKIKHKKHCKKCDWTTMETHNLIYEYDGLRDNMCICGYNEKVKYTFEINDDTHDTISVICDSDSTISPIDLPHKTGYTFDYYEKYELHLCDDTATPSTLNNNLAEVFISTCSSIELDTSEYSTIYRAHFTPIYYSFHYSNENNLGLTFDEEIEDTIFEYDKIEKLPKHIHVDGYIFEGWTLATSSNVIIFKDCEEIKNYSIDDYATFTFYPRYRVQDFSIRYECSGGRFNNGNNVLVKSYSYFDESELESLSPYSDESFFRFYTTDIDYNGVPNLSEKETGYNLYKKMVDVKKLLALNEKDSVTLTGHIGRLGESSAEHSTDGGGLAPDGKGGFKKDLNKNDEKGKNDKNGENSIIYENIINGITDDVVGGKNKNKDKRIDDVLAKIENIEVFDLSQTILEHLGGLIATKSYLNKYNSVNFSIFVCMMWFLQFITKFQVEIILLIFVIVIIVIYLKNE